MDLTSQPAAPDSPLMQGASDPYCGTPLGVEAAWCPNGIDAQLPAATETALSLMEPRC